MDPQAGLQVAQVTDDAFREAVVYTPPGRSCICIEPYTCVTDAVHLAEQGIDGGWRVLEPGEEFLTWIDLRPGLVYA
jgi:aldose 1-epimerase